MKTETSADASFPPRRDLAWRVGSILIAVPVLCLVVAAIAWLRHGIDFPLWDDWRDYRFYEAGSLDVAFLFKPANDTLFPVGRLLDSLAFRWFDGHTVVYQLVSMLSVMGLLLWLQWLLLRLAIGDRLRAAAVFTLTLFMLQPESYWGWQNIAYHQAIPLVCILGALWRILRPGWRAAIDVPLVFILGLISGFTYISGAFGALVAGLVLAGSAWLVAQADRARFRQGGIAVALSGVISTAAQLWVIIAVQQGTHRADAPMALPSEADFWFYLLGKIGRALMFPPAHPRLSLVLTLAFVAFTTGLAVWALRSALETRAMQLVEARTVVTFATLLGVIGIYLLLVAAGRTKLRPTELDTPIEVFRFGYLRFHYLWVTLLLPWVAALALDASSRGRRSTARSTASILVLAGLATASSWVLGGWEHGSYFLRTEALRQESVRCLALRHAIGVDVPCKEAVLDVPLAAFRYGIARGASFSDAVPLPLIPLGTSAPLLRLEATDWPAVERAGVDLVAVEEAQARFRTTGAPHFFFELPTTAALERCGVVNVALRARWNRIDQARLDFLLPDQTDFSTTWSSVHDVAPTSGLTEVHFQIRSASGFGHRFRFAPTAGGDDFSLGALEMRCLAPAPIEPMSTAGPVPSDGRMQPTPPLAEEPLPLRFSAAHLAGGLPLERIEILFGTWMRRNEGVARLRLRDAAATETILEFDLGELQDNTYRAFDLPRGHYVSGDIAPVTGGGVSVWESAVADGSVESCVVYTYANGHRRFTAGCQVP